MNRNRMTNTPLGDKDKTGSAVEVKMERCLMDDRATKGC